MPSVRPAPGLASAADLFDRDRFPGSRALRCTPRVNLERAPLADGVPADQLYAVLATEAGVDRALAKLDTNRESIVWWDGSEARLGSGGRTRGRDV